jgi:hypothetical protein
LVGCTRFCCCQLVTQDFVMIFFCSSSLHSNLHISTRAPCCFTQPFMHILLKFVICYFNLECGSNMTSKF